MNNNNNDNIILRYINIIIVYGPNVIKRSARARLSIDLFPSGLSWRRDVCVCVGEGEC